MPIFKSTVIITGPAETREVVEEANEAHVNLVKVLLAPEYGQEIDYTIETKVEEINV